MSQVLSSYLREGWEVKTMSVERRRTALFWSREAYLFVLERPLSDGLRLVYPFKPGVSKRQLSGLTDMALLLHFLHALPRWRRPCR